jgi:Lon protease-like protein
MPFDDYKIGALTIEHNFEEPKRSRIRGWLTQQGYRLARTQFVDDWYVLEGVLP